MKKQILVVMTLLTLPLVTQAARVAVTDSGTDFSHERLQGRALINENEIAGNLVDDDRNGKVDDVMGWNFVDDYGKIFFPEHLQSVDTKIFKYFEIIARIQAGTQTKEDEEFWKNNVTGLDPEAKAALLAKLNFYGQYAHSTHVSGIIAAQSNESKIMSNRVFADTPPEDMQVMSLGVTPLLTAPTKAVGPMDLIYKLLAAMTNGTFEKVAVYMKERQIDVANYSLGVSLQNIAKLVLVAKGNKNPTPEQIAAETQRIAAQFMPVGKKWMQSSPDTLFVVAAGNDGTDNDAIPTFPANVRVENSITVAATNNFASLAKFSNYGATNVDVAAPGVAILSSVPSLDHKQLLPLSGTSMAAPYVTGVAAKAKSINSKLSANDIKSILMSTVDVKDWLKGKVISSGIVNAARVAVAAEKSKTMPLAEAISFAKAKVRDHGITIPVITGFDKTTDEMQREANSLVY